MTAEEYQKAYIAARRKMPTLIRAVMRDIQAAYTDATEKVIADFLGASGLAEERLASIESQLVAAQSVIADAVNAGTITGLNSVTGMYGAIDEKLLSSLISGTITKSGIQNMVVAVNQRLIADITNRMGQDGYTLSDRCWQTGGDYREQITRLINSGVAQSRSITNIAKDLEQYVQGGVKVLPEGYTQAKYGKLVVKNVDYRALRLVRTELGTSQRESAAQLGKNNLACTQEFDWVRINTQQHGCQCEEWAAGSPYKFEDIPSGHPNDMCQVRPRLRDLREVTADIERWSRGESVPYINDWYNTSYLPNQTP